MADQSNEKPENTAPAADAQSATASETKAAEPASAGDETKQQEASTDNTKVAEDSKTSDSSEKSAEKSAEEAKEGEEKTTTESGDVDMKDATETAGKGSAAAADGDAAPSSTSAQTPAKGKARRKSAVGEAKGKTLNRKGSKARLTHLDAKPGDHFLVKLKGFPAWPAIICDESMLPPALTESRPVTAQRPDGTWNEPYADGGKRAYDRNFPVMYLYTNEFGWVLNSNLTELSPEKAEDSVTDKMRKDLREAYLLAAENNPVEHYKDILQKFEEELAAQEEARREAAATPKKSKKGKAKAVDEDVDMVDADTSVSEKPKSKKRKAEEEASTPQRPDSVKKPKIKLNTSSTPKTANGTSTPKAKDESAAKSKSKSKKSKDGADKKAEVPKEPKMTPEERHARKEKEVLYLRHKLQRGLLTRDQQPQESEMKAMSDYIGHLENFTDLEVSIIRTTKINKVLKAILKLESIPREDEFNFKDRSQKLLDKWNKLMAGDGAPAATNGVNGSTDRKKSKDAKVDTEESKKAEEKSDEDAAAEKPAKKSEAKSEAPAADDKSDKPSSEAIVPPEPVETKA